MAMDQYLIVNEIFSSIQGEALHSGFPCVFVRLQGCPLKCKWCDTRYSCIQDGGEKKSISSILDKVRAFGIDTVEMTGGEPLAQEVGARSLISRLIAENYRVLLETNGLSSIAGLPEKLHIIMDIKCPGSGIDGLESLHNIAFLKESDEIKFVLTDRKDFDWAHGLIHKHGLDKKFNLVMSPVWGSLDPKDLAQWLIASSFRCRLGLQLHKYIWGPDARGV